MPGTDPIEATRIIRGELGEPNLPHLVELPDRGVGSDPLGRTAGMLLDLHVDVQPHGWRLVDRPGIDHRRAVSALRTDINVLADIVGEEEQPGNSLKLRIMGPATMAAGLYLPAGERALSDHGARRDIAESLAAGAASHVRDAIRTSGMTDLTVQVDEPALGDVLAGTIPTASGYRTIRSIPRTEVTGWWATMTAALLEAGAAEVVFAPTLAGDEPGKVFDAVFGAGAQGISVPVADLTTVGWEHCAAAVEAGRSLWLGLLTPGLTPPQVTEAVNRVLRPWNQIGLGNSSLGSLGLLPTQGMGEHSPVAVRSVLSRLTQIADALDQVRLEG